MRSSTRHASSAAALMSVVALLAGCGSSSSPPSRSKSAGASDVRSISIQIVNFAYHPAVVTVAPGARVTFTNHDRTAHTATSSATPPVFDTGTLAPGKSKTITVSKPGSYGYFCQFHAFMHGTLIVAR